MSQHPSLKATGFGVKHRNVLKRFERMKKMKTDERWSDVRSAYGLPKIKSVKIKVKKIKEAKVPAAGGAAAAPAAGAAAPAAKAAAPKPKGAK